MAWFNSPGLEDPRVVEFVAALTRAAVDGAFSDVVPGDSLLGPLSERDGPGVTVGLVVPGLTVKRRYVLVSYEPGADDETPVLQSGWSSSAQLDVPVGAYDGPSNDQDLWVGGIAAPPTLCAEWASAWFVRQLRRPVVRREWDQPESGRGAGLFGRRGESVAVEWWLTEPELYLEGRGTFGRWWLTRQPPSREIHERP